MMYRVFSGCKSGCGSHANLTTMRTPMDRWWTCRGIITIGRHRPSVRSTGARAAAERSGQESSRPANPSRTKTWKSNLCDQFRRSSNGNARRRCLRRLCLKTAWARGVCRYRKSRSSFPVRHPPCRKPTCRHPVSISDSIIDLYICKNEAYTVKLWPMGSPRWSCDASGTVCEVVLWRI